jgi:hypothetical protein
MVRDIQQELDSIIQIGVFNITRLLRKSDTANEIAIEADDEDIHKKYKHTRKFLKEKFTDIE